MRVAAICALEHAMGLMGQLHGSVLLWDISRSLEISRESVWLECENLIDVTDEFSVFSDVQDLFHVATYRATPDEMSSILEKLPYNQVVLCCNSPDHAAQYSFAKSLLTQNQVDEYIKNQG